MARSKKLNPKFNTYDAQPLLYSLGLRGHYTLDSEIKGTGYAFVGNTLLIAGGKSGALSVDFDKLEQFAIELLDIKDLYDERKRMGVKGA
jgi:hypothetical protein